MFALSDFFCFHLGLISNGNFQVKLSKETDCEKKSICLVHFIIYVSFKCWKVYFQEDFLEYYPIGFVTKLSSAIGYKQKKLTRRKPTNVNERLMKQF